MEKVKYCSSLQNRTNRLLIIIHLFLFYRSVARFLKKFYLIQYMNHDLLCVHQSSFKPLDSCKYQLISIVHDIYASFDCILLVYVRGVFLDIYKSFDRVWHGWHMYKIKCIGINGIFLKLILSFLENRSERVVLNG